MNIEEACCARAEEKQVFAAGDCIASVGAGIAPAPFHPGQDVAGLPLHAGSQILGVGLSDDPVFINDRGAGGRDRLLPEHFSRRRVVGVCAVDQQDALRDLQMVASPMKSGLPPLDRAIAHVERNQRPLLVGIDAAAGSEASGGAYLLQFFQAIDLVNLGGHSILIKAWKGFLLVCP